MKTKLLALGFSLAFLLGNAVYGGQGVESESSILTLEPFVVYPHVGKLLNDQILEPVNFVEIIRSNVEEILEANRQFQIKTVIAYELEVIQDVPLVAASQF